jgi:glycosyltransferase involved in cell wall biosynthesis
MHIAVITDTYYAVNGVSRTYQEMVKYCRAKKIRLDVFTIGQKPQTQKLGCVTIYQFPTFWPVKYYYDMPPFDVRIIPAGFKEKLSRTKYDIIHLATPGSLGIAARQILLNDSTPKVAVFHTLIAEYAGSWTEKNLQNLPSYLRYPLVGFSQATIWRFLKWFYAKTDLVLAPSLEIKNKLKILNRPVQVVPHGVDTDLFNPKYKNLKLKNKLPVALYAGRISIEKNLDLLVKIFKSRKDIELWLVGEGPYRQGLKNQLPQAKFFGYLSGKKLSEIYASADFFVFPSVTDTFGNVILEAQASGLPVIVTDVGGPKELVKPKINGLIAKPTAQDFGQAIDFLAKNIKARKIMGKNARKFAENKSWQKAFDQLIGVYKRLM